MYTYTYTYQCDPDRGAKAKHTGQTPARPQALPCSSSTHFLKGLLAALSTGVLWQSSLSKGLCIEARKFGTRAGHKISPLGQALCVVRHTCGTSGSRNWKASPMFAGHKDSRTCFSIAVLHLHFRIKYKHLTDYIGFSPEGEKSISPVLCF